MKPIIGSFANNHDNNFNLLRLIAASAVIASHSWPLVEGASDGEPLKLLINVTFGSSAVAVFFGISGYLVAASWERNPSIIAFVVARALRILPGLLVMLLLTVLLGATVTSLPSAEYFSNQQTWGYLIKNFTLRYTSELPGVFTDSPYPRAVNGSIWTLFYEATCYASLLVIAVCVRFRRPLLAGVLMAVLFACVLAQFFKPTHLLFQNAALLFPPFFAGVAAWVWRDRIRLNGWMVLTLLVATAIALRVNMPAAKLLFFIVLTGAALWFAFIPKGAIRAFNKLGDCSYGVYIYAFPLQQSLVHFFPGISVAALTAAAVPTSIILGSVSWLLIEKPAIGLRKSLLPILRWRTPVITSVR